MSGAYCNESRLITPTAHESTSGSRSTVATMNAAPARWRATARSGRNPNADTGQVDTDEHTVGLLGDQGAGTAGAARQVDNAITGTQIEHVT